MRDFEGFFASFSRQDWDAALSYLSNDCVWDASERRMEGQEAIKGYWTGDHAARRETLAKPHDVVFGQGMAYLQTVARL